MPDATPATSTSPSTGGKSSGTFGFLTKKIGPVPIWVIIVAAVALWYWYFHYGPGAQSQAATAKQPKGGGDQVVNVRIIDNDQGRRTGPGPRPGQHNPSSTKLITIERDMTLAQAAEYYHWSKDTLGDIEQMNAQQYHGHLTPDTQLHKGDQILRPIGDDDAGSGSRWRNS